MSKFSDGWKFILYSSSSVMALVFILFSSSVETMFEFAVFIVFSSSVRVCVIELPGGKTLVRLLPFRSL